MTRLGQLKEMLSAADSRRYDAHEYEGTDAAGRHCHSLCGHDGDPLDAGSGAGDRPRRGSGQSPEISLPAGEAGVLGAAGAPKLFAEDDRDHVCFGQTFGSTKEEAAARAILVAKTLQELPDLLTELYLLRRMAAAGEALLDDHRVSTRREWDVELEKDVPALDPVRVEFVDTVKDWAAYWKPKP